MRCWRNGDEGGIMFMGTPRLDRKYWIRERVKKFMLGMVQTMSDF